LYDSEQPFFFDADGVQAKRMLVEQLAVLCGPVVDGKRFRVLSLCLQPRNEFAHFFVGQDMKLRHIKDLIARLAGIGKQC
jgi:hypothetical protein